MLMKIFTDEKPDYLAVAFDKGRIVFRHADFKDYKAQRKGMPDELRPQMKIIKDILEAMNIPIFEEEGYEADDLIGSMVKWGEKQGWQNLIVTGDRDALQLVTKQTKVLFTKKGISELEVYDIKAIKEKYNLTPEQIVDLKGLMGDASDNIPGVPGVGEKTALKLLAEYDSIENILEHLDDFQGKKLGERLRENQDMAILSKKLATIFCCVEMELDADTLRVKKPDYEKLSSLYEELEFRNLLKNLIQEEKPLNSNLNSTGLIISHPKDLKEALEKEDIKELTIYFEYDSSDAQKGRIISLAIMANKQCFYIPQVYDFHLYAKILKPYLEDDRIPIVTYDAKLLYVFLGREKVNIKGMKWDVMLGCYLLNPSRNDLSLKSLIYDYLHEVVPEEEEKQAFSLVQGLYLLAQEMIKLLEKDELMPLYLNIEISVAKVLAAMELQGVRLDKAQLKAMGKELEARIEVLTDKIYILAEEEFNINSPKQLGVILFEKLGLPPVKKTKTGYSTNAEVLEFLADKHEIVQEILNYRQLVKLKSTYVDGLMNLINPKTKKVHTSFNQTITATGRLSSTEPNLQNIPIRLEEGRKIRKAFIPSKEGYILLTADYSQIELRVLAHMADATSLINAFNNDEDIHLQTAMKIFDIENKDDVTSLQRRQAKAVNFGIIYGISDWGLAEQLGVSVSKAKDFINKYFATFPEIKTYLDKAVSDCEKNGYVKTLFNRIRYVKEINDPNYTVREFGKRVAMNAPIQGTAADIIKKAMLDIDKLLNDKNYQTKMLLQIHDELVFEVPENELMEVIPLICETMENAASLKVRLKVDYGYGKNWYDAK